LNVIESYKKIADLQKLALNKTESIIESNYKTIFGGK